MASYANIFAEKNVSTRNFAKATQIFAAKILVN